MSMMHRKDILFVTVIALALVCVVPHLSYAQTTAKFVPLAVYDKSPQFNDAFNSGSLPQYISNVFKIVLSVGAILAVLRIAYGGYLSMGSADMWGNRQQAKEAISDAIIGLLLLFAIYLVLNQINPNLLNLDVIHDVKSTAYSP